ncbi:MAG TPA: response regulator [Gemmatimonadaceae bacterium]|jgi:two-component system LytT family response regulator
MTSHVPGGFPASLRILIVDDEPLARRHLRAILDADADVEVIGEAANGREAVQMIAKLAPDLVLLDVQMPEVDGFSVVAQIDPDRMPMFVFVTAYDSYALKAFDVHAIDYVLKPVARDRLLQSVTRAKTRIASPNGTSDMAEFRQFVEEMKVSRGLDRLAIRVDGKHLLLPTESIDWIEAVDDYVRIHTGKTSHLVRGTLASFQSRLPALFMRIHRSAIVNTSRIKEVFPNAQGDYRITLLDGTRLPSGRSYRGAVAEFLRSLTV